MVLGNSAQNLEAFIRKCPTANLFIKILTKLLPNECEGGPFLVNLQAKILNFLTDYNSFLS